MFKKLKRKFIMINMLMMSVVMLCAFVVIYMITFTNIQNQNKLKLENISSSTLSNIAPNGNSVMFNTQGSISEYLQAFSVIIDASGKLVSDSSLGMISKDLTTQAIEQVRKQNSDSGKIVLNDKQYQYSFSIASVKVRAINDNTNELEQFFKIAFLDVTQSQNTISQLLITFIFIWILMLFVNFGISVLFAKRTVAPIEQSYIKQRQFIQDASHELKTPLASINANLDAVTANPKETVETQKKWLGFISNEIDRMTKLVNDLLYLAKSDHAILSIDASPVNFSEVLENAIASIETVMFEKGINFNQQIELDVVVKGDKDKIYQVINILLDNALKYTNAKGRIDVLLGVSKNQVTLSVSNTGEGIAQEHIGRIFDRFYRVDTSRKNNGNYGLGLAIAKSLVEGMNGDIYVASIPNEQTLFIVKLNRA